MFTPLLYVLAASNFSEDYDPSKGTNVQNPTVRTGNAGSCSVAGVPPTASATIHFEWKWYNRNDALYEVQISLQSFGTPRLSFTSLADEQVWSGLGVAKPTWEQGNLNAATEYGILTFTGFVEIEQSITKANARLGGFGFNTADWLFTLKKVRKANGYVAAASYLPWRRVYAAC